MYQKNCKGRPVTCYITFVLNLLLSQKSCAICTGKNKETLELPLKRASDQTISKCPLSVDIGKPFILFLTKSKANCKIY